MAIFPKDFDWQAYLIHNPDIARKQCTQRFAFEHWRNYGRFERRSYQLQDKLWPEYLRQKKIQYPYMQIEQILRLYLSGENSIPRPNGPEISSAPSVAQEANQTTLFSRQPFKLSNSITLPPVKTKARIFFVSQQNNQNKARSDELVTTPTITQPTVSQPALASQQQTVKQVITPQIAVEPPIVSAVTTNLPITLPAIVQPVDPAPPALHTVTSQTTVDHPIVEKVETIAKSIKKTILVVTHNMGGGTERSVQNLMTFSQYGFCILRSINNGIVSLEFADNKYRLNIHKERGKLVSLIKERVHAIHVNQLVGYPLDPILAFFREISVPYMVTLRDWYPFCGDYASPFTKSTASFDAKMKQFLSRAKLLVVPSNSVRERYLGKYPQLDFQVVPNEVLSYQDHIQPWTAGAILKVGIIGHLLNHKGEKIVDACLKDINKHNLPIHIYIFGVANIKNEALTNTGPYTSEEQLFERIAQYQPDIYWIPGLYHETYCYVLSIIQKLGRAYMSADLPIFVERGKSHKGFYPYQGNYSPEQIVKHMQYIQSQKPERITKAVTVSKNNPKYIELYAQLLR